MSVSSAAASSVNAAPIDAASSGGPNISGAALAAGAASGGAEISPELLARAIQLAKQEAAAAAAAASSSARVTTGTIQVAVGTYTGQIVDGKPNGRGVLTYNPDDQYFRSKYEGQFVDGQISGQGTLTWRSGNKVSYTGEWKDNKLHGQGKLIYSETDEYGRVSLEGAFVADVLSGKATMVWKSGQVYRGEWRNDNLDGQGVMDYSRDDQYQRQQYDGNWSNGKRHGRGILVWTTGKRYEGMWDSDEVKGAGKMTYPHGEVHEGAFDSCIEPQPKTSP